MTDKQKPDTIAEALYDYGTDFISHPASRSIGDIEEAGTIMLAARNSFLRLQAENEALRADVKRCQSFLNQMCEETFDTWTTGYRMQGIAFNVRAAMKEKP